MIFITYIQLNLFQTLVNCFPFFQRRKRKKPRGKFWFINLLQKLMKLIKTMLTKKSEKQLFFFAKILNPGWEGVKSIPKTGQSLPINGNALRAGLWRPWELEVLSTGIVVVWRYLYNLWLDCTMFNNNCKCGGRLCSLVEVWTYPRGFKWFWYELGGNTFENVRWGKLKKC